MPVCAMEMDDRGPNPDNPNYAWWEWDFYHGIPVEKETERTPNHRLSLRKNLKTGKFEVYRHYAERVIRPLENLVLDTSVNEVVFVGDFIQAFEFANSEVLQYHGVGLFEICGGCRIGSKDPIDHY